MCKITFFRIFSITNFILHVCLSESYTDYKNWKFHFPQGSFMGIFLAVAIPLNLPHNSVYLAYNFEALYNLPFNETDFTYPPLIERNSRTIDRKQAYDVLEAKMETYGYPGRSCLLRTICEASISTMDYTNGVFGDILHIIFTPSSSINTELNNNYTLAEEYGRKYENCSIYNKECYISFLDIVFLALALPLDLPDSNVFVSYNFEANYNLPQNESEFDYPPVVSRSLSFDRKFAYKVLEQKIEAHGYSGKACLLRAICEASEHTMDNTGVLGDILHVFLTPSTSQKEDINADYFKAEQYGKIKNHCKKYHKNCTISILRLVTFLGKST